MTADEEALVAWEALAEPWKMAFEQAWISWCGGNVGVGAVLMDPVLLESALLAGHGIDAAVVGIGRNRVNESVPVERKLAGTWMAHAEMNVFASMGRFTAKGCDLYTTLEPCFMCAATTIQMNVVRVFAAAKDEFFAGLEDLWQHHPYPAQRAPEMHFPLAIQLACFGRMITLNWALRETPESTSIDVARQLAPHALGAAEADLQRGSLRSVKDSGGTVADALVAVWDLLSHLDEGAA